MSAPTNCRYRGSPSRRRRRRPSPHPRSTTRSAPLSLSSFSTQSSRCSWRFLRRAVSSGVSTGSSAGPSAGSAGSSAGSARGPRRGPRGPRRGPRGPRRRGLVPPQAWTSPRWSGSSGARGAAGRSDLGAGDPRHELLEFRVVDVVGLGLDFVAEGTEEVVDQGLAAPAGGRREAHNQIDRGPSEFGALSCRRPALRSAGSASSPPTSSTTRRTAGRSGTRGSS